MGSQTPDSCGANTNNIHFNLYNVYLFIYHIKKMENKAKIKITHNIKEERIHKRNSLGNLTPNFLKYKNKIK